jgi:hypothetical protein
MPEAESLRPHPPTGANPRMHLLKAQFAKKDKAKNGTGGLIE